MEFTFDFNWRDYLPKSVFRADNADISPTTRLAFTGMIGREDQTPKELHADLQAAERQDWGEIKFVQDTNGRIRGRAVITTIGVYPYLREDGTVRWELRHPDDVYDEASLRSLELLPLTNDHPSEKVTKDNVQDLKVGHLGENVWVDTMHGYVTNTVIVDVATAIDAVNSGKRALSSGYSCDVVEESGVWGGVPYDARQKNIRYNHVSIVNRGRAGDDAVMKFDSYEGIQTKASPETKLDNPVETAVVNTDEEVTMGDKNMKTVKLDGVDYEAEPAVITALHKANEKLDSFSTLQAKFDEQTKQLATVEGERDSLKKDKADLEKELQNSIKVDQLDELFQKRTKLDEAVSLAKVEDAAKMDAIGRMEAVVVAVDPTAKEVLASRKDSDGYQFYLEARFDSAVAKLKEDESILVQNLSSATGVVKKIDSEDGKKVIKTDEDIWNTLVDACSKKKKGA